jgi:hypothetical protein
MLQYINKKVPSNNCRVAIVSVPKMERLNILWHQSDVLVEQAGGKAYSGRYQDGVQFAWPRHYLVYGWIPAQCVIKTLTLQRFRQPSTLLGTWGCCIVTRPRWNRLRKCFTGQF